MTARTEMGETLQEAIEHLSRAATDDIATSALQIGWQFWCRVTWRHRVSYVTAREQLEEFMAGHVPTQPSIGWDARADVGRRMLRPWLLCSAKENGMGRSNRFGAKPRQSCAHRPAVNVGARLFCAEESTRRRKAVKKEKRDESVSIPL